MATDKIELEIVTPKGLALKASVDEVTAPSVNGEFGIMPGHLPVLVALHTGVVTYRIGNEAKKVAVGEGWGSGRGFMVQLGRRLCVQAPRPGSFAAAPRRTPSILLARSVYPLPDDPLHRKREVHVGSLRLLLTSRCSPPPHLDEFCKRCDAAVRN